MGKRFTKKVFVAVVIGVLCLCTMAAFAAERGNTNGNIQNGGTVLEYKGYLYVGSNTKSGGTVRINLETGEAEHVLPYETYCLNAVDGWLYANIYSIDNLLNYGPGVTGVYKFRPDGSELTCLVDTFMTDLQVYGDNLYGFLEFEGLIYTIKTDGTGFREISEYSFDSLNVGDDGLLYATQRNLYCINPEDGSFYPILDVNFSNYLIERDCIYYLDKRNLFKVPLDGSAVPAQIAETKSNVIYNAILAEDKFLYAIYVSGKEEVIFSVDINTGEEKELGVFQSSRRRIMAAAPGKVIYRDYQDQNTDICVHYFDSGETHAYNTFVYEEPSIDFSKLGDDFIVHKIEADADYVNVKSVNEDGILTECQNGDYMLVGLDGEVKFRRDDIYVRGFSEGLAVARYKADENLAGFIDTTGDFMIEPQFDEVDGFSSGYALVQKDGIEGYIDPSGAYAYIAEDGERLKPFSHVYAVVEFPNSVRVFDTSFQTMVVADAGNRYANAELFGVTENCLIVSLHYFQDNNYVNKVMIISRDGEILWEEIPGSASGLAFVADPSQDTFYFSKVDDDGNYIVTINDSRGNELVDLTLRQDQILKEEKYEDMKIFRQGGFAAIQKENDDKKIIFLDPDFKETGALTYSSYTVTDHVNNRYDSSYYEDYLKGDYLFLTLNKEYFDRAGKLPIYVIEPKQSIEELKYGLLGKIK